MISQKLDPIYKHIWGIYKIINIINNKVYIGSSKNIYKRIMSHFQELIKGSHQNKHLQNSFDKYGINSFKVEILKTILYDDFTERNLRDLETSYIQKYKSYMSDFGYNIVSVGVGTSSRDFTEERKRKISKSHIGMPAHNKGVPMTIEQKLILKNINTEKYGKKISVFDMIGNLIGTYNSIREVNRIYNIPRDSINGMCKGNIGRYNNMITRYSDIEDVGRQCFLTHKNKTYAGPFYFYIESIDGNDKKIFLNKQSVESYIGTSNKNKKLQKWIKELINRTDDEYIIINNYKIRFIYALSNSNIAIVVRQSGLVPEVI